MRFSRRFQAIVALAVILGLLLSGASLFLRRTTPSAYSLVEQTTLSVLKGKIDYRPAGEPNWRAAQGGEVLRVGDRVRTAQDSHGLITFFEGSTTELEPETEVEITRLDTPETTGQVGLGLKQSLGTTWSRVTRIVDVQSRVEVETPTAVAMVRGTEFEVTVTRDMRTQVMTSVGRVDLQSEGVVIPVEAGFLSVAEPGQPPSPPVPAPPPRRAFTITLHQAGRLFITDSRGRSLGFFPETNTYINQIPGAWYSGSDSEPQVIALPNPEEKYRVVIAPDQAPRPTALGGRALVAGWYLGAGGTPEAGASRLALPGAASAGPRAFRVQLQTYLDQALVSGLAADDLLGDDEVISFGANLAGDRLTGQILLVRKALRELAGEVAHQVISREQAGRGDPPPYATDPQGLILQVAARVMPTPPPQLGPVAGQASQGANREAQEARLEQVLVRAVLGAVSQASPEDLSGNPGMQALATIASMLAPPTPLPAGTAASTAMAVSGSPTRPPISTLLTAVAATTGTPLPIQTNTAGPTTTPAPPPTGTTVPPTTATPAPSNTPVPVVPPSATPLPPSPAATVSSGTPAATPGETSTAAPTVVVAPPATDTPRPADTPVPPTEVPAAAPTAASTAAPTAGSEEPGGSPPEPTGQAPAATTAPTATATATSVATATTTTTTTTATPTATATPAGSTTPTASPTGTLAGTTTATLTATSSVTPAATSTVTLTATATGTATATATPTEPPTATSTPTITPTTTPSLTPTPVATATPSPYDVFWAAAVSGSWTDASKWSTGAVPGPTASVYITQPGDYTVTLAVNASVGSVTLGGPSGVQTLRLQASVGYNHVNLTAADRFLNSGTLVMDASPYSGYNAQLSVTNGVLVNTGTLQVNQGSGGGRYLSANLDNLGMLKVDYGLNLSKAGGSFTNTGTVNVAAGHNLSMSGNSQQFSQNGGTIALAGGFAISDATLNFNGGTITGNPVTMVDATLNVGPFSTGAGSVKMRGTCSLSGNIAAGQTVWLNPGPSYDNATVTAATGFSNAGTIRMEASTYSGYNAWLGVTNGTLVNTGTLEVNQGSGGARTLGANLVNEGTVNVNYDLALSRASGVYANTGTINVAGGQTLSMAGSSQRFNQNGGTIALSGGFLIQGATLNFNGGTITGNPVTMVDATLNVGPFSTGAGSVKMRGTCSLSGNIAAGQTVWLNPGPSYYHSTVTAATGFTNAGTLRMEASTYSGYNAWLGVTSGVLVNTGTIVVNAGSGGARTLAADLENRGTISVNDSLALSRWGGVYANLGTVNVAAGQTLSMVGNGQQFNQNGGTMGLSGGFLVQSATLNFNGGALTGNPATLIDAALNLGPSSTGAGSFTLRGACTLSGNVASTQSLWLNPGPSYYSSSVTAATGFSNAGTIRMEASTYSGYNAWLGVSSGVLVNTGTIVVNPGSGGSRTLSASLDNRGTLTVNDSLTLAKAYGVHANTGTVSVAASQTLTVSGNYQQFNQNDGTIALSGGFLVQGATLNFNGGAITGNAATIVDSALNFGASSMGAGSFTMRGVCTLSGNIAAGQTVWLNPGPSYYHSTVTAATGFTNAGRIRMESSVYNGYNAWLGVTSGTLVNTGTIDVLPGVGGTRTLAGRLDNRGTLNVSDSLSLAKFNGVHTNTGTINVGGGQTLSMSGNAQTFHQDGGTMALSGSFYVNGGVLNFNGGTLTGNAATVVDSALNLASNSSGAGSFALRGTGTLSGNIAAGQTVWLNPGPSYDSSTITAASGFTNAGTLRMESSVYGGYNAWFGVTSGTLVNTGTIDILPGAGGTRTISADLDNRGTLNVSDSLTLSRAGGSYVNTGTISVAASQTLNLSGRTLANDSSGVLTGRGTISGNVTNAGQVNPGSPLGTLTIGGNYTQAAAGTLNLEVGTAYDRLAVTGSASLAGTLNLLLSSGYYPSGGATFDVLTFSSRGGTDFATVNGEPPYWTRSYLASALRLTGTGAATPVPTVGAPAAPAATTAATPATTPAAAAVATGTSTESATATATVGAVPTAAGGTATPTATATAAGTAGVAPTATATPAVPAGPVPPPTATATAVPVASTTATATATAVPAR